MPIASRIVRTLDDRAADLSQRLAEEWTNPTSHNSEPVIVPERDPTSGATRIYVFWSKWTGLNQRERSEVIMEAFQQVHGLDPNQRVTVAMGLTPEEAEQLGIRYE
jgi:hypothetical protein